MKKERKDIAWMIGIIASCISIFSFLTGYQSIRQFFSKDSDTTVIQPTSTLVPTLVQNSSVTFSVNQSTISCPAAQCYNYWIEMSIDDGNIVKFDYRDVYTVTLPGGTHKWKAALVIEWDWGVSRGIDPMVEGSGDITISSTISNFTFQVESKEEFNLTKQYLALRQINLP